MTKSFGQATTKWSTPSATASRIRFSLGRSACAGLVIQIRPPPAPQQNVFSPFLRHLHQLAAERGEHLPRRFGQPVMPGQVAGIVVGHPHAERLDRDGAVRPAALRAAASSACTGLSRPNAGYSLRRVLNECGISGEDLLEAGAAERLHVLLGEHLEQALLADPAHVVAVVALAVEEHPEVHARVAQDVRQAARQHLEPLVERGEVADEPQVLHRLLAGVLDGEAELACPPGAHPARLAERVALAGRRSGAPAGRRARSRPRRQAGGADARSCRRARCPPGTARRRHRRWCRTTARPGRSPPQRRRSARGGAVAGPPADIRPSRRPMMSSLGESGWPLAQAGHTVWHRPHSVQVSVSSRCFQVSNSSCGACCRGGGGQLAERAERPRPARERDVQRRHHDMQMLGVGDEDAEAHDHRDVRQQQDRLDAPSSRWRRAA